LLLICGVLPALVLTVSCGTGEPGPDPVDYTVMTYNILVALPNPEYDSWDIRAEFVADALLRHEPDLVGLQEPLESQIDDLLDRVPGYAALPLSVLDTDAGILYREDRFEVLEHSIYWLSPTPDVPHSTGFGNFLFRMVLTARMRDRASGSEFFWINTHFDNTPPSQVMSAPLFLERAGPLALELPVIVTGDFNSKPDSEAYQTLTLGLPEGGGDGFLLQDTFFLAPDFEVWSRDIDDKGYDTSGRIDHIFVAGGPFSCTRWIVDKTTYGPDLKDPSDHFPIVAHLEPGPAREAVE